MRAFAAGPLQAHPDVLPGHAQSFLDFCRVEKGLAINSISSYTLDLKTLPAALTVPFQPAPPDDLARHVESLYRAGLSARSIARHITTLRNFFSFLLRESEIDRDPSELLALPRQWSTLPKYMNREQIERLLDAPP